MELRSAFLAQASTDLGAAQQALAASPGRALASWLDTQLARCDDEAFAVRFAAACPVAGADPAAYLHRVIGVEADLAVLAGIRFKGGDLGQPFVDVLAWSARLDAQRWRAICEQLREAFAAFRPPALRIRWAGSEPPPFVAEGLAVDQHLLAGRLGALVVQRPSVESARFRRATDTTWYAQFTAAFARWSEEAGALAAEVQAASEADLTACIEGGAVVCAWQGETWAGLAAAAPAAERALAGYCMMEELLDTPLRGRGLGVAIQGALVSELAAHHADAVLWGTIHGTNLASLRTAERCGRRVVETWWFVSLDGAA